MEQTRREMELYCTLFTDGEMEKLCRGDTRHIQKLSIGSNELTFTATIYLHQARWDQLVHLDLRENEIRNIGCKYLSRARLPVLTDLVLSNNQIGCEGVMHLSKGSWSTLQRLFLWLNVISINGLKSIISSNWPQIETIALQYNKIPLCETFHLTLIQQKRLKAIQMESNTGSTPKRLVPLLKLKSQQINIFT